MKEYLSAHLRFTTLYLAFLIMLPGFVYANGAARSTAMGLAFTAVADDASAVFSNPAGLTQITGKHAYGGISAFDLDSTYTSPIGEQEETRSQIFYSPHLYLSTDLGADARLGLGMFSPFGIGGMKWSGGGLTRYAATENLVGTFSFNPAAAYRLSPVLSIGFGVDYLLSMAEASMKVDQSFLGAEDGEMRTEADGDGWGYNAGILYAPSPDMSFGISYRSAIRVRYKGDVSLTGIAPLLQPLFDDRADYSTAMRTTLDFPSVFAIGIKYKPTTRLIVALDFEKTRWSSFDEAEVDFENEVPAAGFTDTTSRMDWKDVWVIKAGLEFLMSKELALRVGYNYIPTPAPEHTLDPGNPDADLQNIMLGFGYRFEKAVLDVYYMKTLYEKRQVNNSILSGHYENSAQALGFSIGYSF